MTDCRGSLSRARWAQVPLSLALVVGLAGCSSSSGGAGPALRPVVAAPPPKDDGKAAQGGDGGDTHSAALEQLRTGEMGVRNDKQNSVHVPLPDAKNWTRVKFLTVKSLVGFRYGKAHHAIVAAFVTHVDDNMAEGACTKSFEGWAMPLVEAFEVDVHHDPPSAFSWVVPSAAPPAAPPVGAIEARLRVRAAVRPPPKVIEPKTIAIVGVDSLMAKTATVLSRDTYAAAWSAYPAWEKACLVVGVAVSARDDETRAREVRDRFAKEVFPSVKVVAPVEPKERY